MNNKTPSWKAVLLTLAAGCSIVHAIEEEGKGVNREEMKPTSFYDFTVKDIEGKEVQLVDYQGSVCVVVNVASL